MRSPCGPSGLFAERDHSSCWRDVHASVGQTVGRNKRSALRHSSLAEFTDRIEFAYQAIYTGPCERFVRVRPSV